MVTREGKKGKKG